MQVHDREFIAELLTAELGRLGVDQEAVVARKVVGFLERLGALVTTESGLKIAKAPRKRPAPKEIALPVDGEDPKTKKAKFIAAYFVEYQRHYPKSKPFLDGKVQGLMATFLKNVTLEQAIQMVQVYLQMQDPWFIKKGHDFETFYHNRQRILNARLTGGDANLEKSTAQLLAEKRGRLT